MPHNRVPKPFIFSRVAGGSDGSIWGLVTQVVGDVGEQVIRSWVYRATKEGIIQQGDGVQSPPNPYNVSALPPLAVASSSQVWTLNGGNPAILMPDGTWVAKASDLGYLDIAAAADGTVCVLQLTASGCRAMRFDGNNGWIVMPAATLPQLVRIAVASATLIYAIDNNGNVFGYAAAPGSWNALPAVIDGTGTRQSAVRIAAGINGNVWVLDTNNTLYVLTPGAANWVYAFSGSDAPPPLLGLTEIAGIDFYHLIGLTTIFTYHDGHTANHIWTGPVPPPGVRLPILPPPPPPVANFYQGPQQPLAAGTAMSAPATVGDYNETQYLAYRSDEAGPDAHQLVVWAVSFSPGPPSVKQIFPGILMGSAPALAAFNGVLYCAFQSNGADNSLYMTYNYPGIDAWASPAQPIPGNFTGARPALAAFNGQLYCAYQANDATLGLTIISSADGQNWTQPLRFNNVIRVGAAPALAVFNGALYCAFQSVYQSDGWPPGGPLLYVTSSSDGVNWTAPAVQVPGPQLAGAPVLAAYKGRLYCAYRAPPAPSPSPLSALCVITSIDGVNWDPPTTYSLGYPPDKIGALCVNDNYLFAHYTTIWSQISPNSDTLIYYVATSV
jgi:hypothetical protein